MIFKRLLPPLQKMVTVISTVVSIGVGGLLFLAFTVTRDTTKGNREPFIKLRLFLPNIAYSNQWSSSRVEWESFQPLSREQELLLLQDGYMEMEGGNSATSGVDIMFYKVHLLLASGLDNQPQASGLEPPSQATGVETPAQQYERECQECIDTLLQGRPHTPKQIRHFHETSRIDELLRVEFVELLSEQHRIPHPFDVEE